MDFYIFVFSNRTETLDFSNNLRKHRIESSVVATPADLGQTCGLSVKIYDHYINPAMKIFRYARYVTFKALYKATYNGKGKYTFSRINS